MFLRGFHCSSLACPPSEWCMFYCFGAPTHHPIRYLYGYGPNTRGLSQGADAGNQQAQSVLVTSPKESLIESVDPPTGRSHKAVWRFEMKCKKSCKVAQKLWKVVHSRAESLRVAQKIGTISSWGKGFATQGCFAGFTISDVCFS